MAKICLERSCIDAPVGEDKAAGVPKHMWMHLEADLGRVAGALNQFRQPSDCEWRASL